MGKLDDTGDLLDLYLHHCGESEIPPQFHLWACLSMIAASVADRVVLERHKGLLPPNFYCFLIGQSGCGKEKAINTAVKFVADIPVVNALNLRATAPHLIDMLGQKRKDPTTKQFTISNPKFYLVTEELNMSIREGSIAQDFISLMTKLYNPQPLPLKEGIRGRGTTISIEGQCANWLAGTNEGWLIRSVPKDAIEGGFWARVMGVRGARDYNNRYSSPIFPEDYEEVRIHIQERIYWLSELDGIFGLSDEAKVFQDAWYMGRPKPSSRDDEPAWNRADEMIQKFALLLALCEWNPLAGEECPWMVEARHLEEAVELYESVINEAPAISRLASATTNSKQVDDVREILLRAGEMDRSTLMKRAANKGLNKYDLDKALATLMDEESIEVSLTPSGKGRIYTWTS